MIDILYTDNKNQLRKTIIGIIFLFYVISCGSPGSISSPSSEVAELNLIKDLTLKEVREESISINWELLKTEEGVVDLTVIYTVYVETPDGEGVFTRIPDTEMIYTLLFPVDLGGGKMSMVLSVDGTGTAGTIVGALSNNTPYRIVVEARDISRKLHRSRLLAYTASALTNVDIIGLDAATIIDSDTITVTWETNSGAQSYLIQASEGENQFGGDVWVDNVFAVVCLPGSPLCERGDQFAEPLEDGRLRYVLQVNKKRKYKLAVIPFNFQDLAGLQAVDEEGRVRTFSEEVLTQIEDKNSVLSQRLKITAESDKAQGVQVQVNSAQPPTDLILDSTGSTLSVSWGHGTGAEYYYAILTGEGVDAVTNTIDRDEPSGRFTGGGYVGFSNLTTNTVYTVTVQSLTVIDNTTHVGGEVSATLPTKDSENTLSAPEKVIGEDLTLTNEEGKIGIVWDTLETNSVIGYHVFYWVGDTPQKPQYVARKGETNLTFTVPPGNYHVRIDVLSTFSGKEVVTGDIDSIAIYGKPQAPRNLGIAFNQGGFTNIENKLYAIGYPLTYTEADTPTEAGGPVGEVAYHYRYRVGEGDWIGYSEVVDEAIISLQVDDLGDATVIKSGYGKNYQVEVIASNKEFVSETATLEFIYKSFPEPFIQSNHLVVEAGDRSLTVTWPAVREVNGSTIANYTVVLNEDPYAESVRRVTTVKRKVVFENLVNNQPYLVTVIPNGTATGNLLTALSVVTGYTIGDAIGKESQEDAILTAYVGLLEPYTPQGSPDVVVNFGVVADIDKSQATVSWDEPAQGSPATGYRMEYLLGVTTSITNVYIGGDTADAELSRLSWKRATSVGVITNDIGSYSQVISNLNVLSATNVFRVRAVRVDGSGKEWLGEYRYYALGVDASRAPSSVREITFSEHALNGSFNVAWDRPDDPGLDYDNTIAQLAGYKVSWGTTAELDGGSIGIDEPDTLSYTIENLTPGTQYYVKVQAKNDNVQGNHYNDGSIETTYTIRRPGAVPAITYSGHTTNSFKVSWDAADAGYGPKGPLAFIGYRLELSNQGGWRHIARSDYLATEETLAGLDPGTGYQVRVTATNGFSSSELFTPLIGETFEGGNTWTLTLSGQVSDLVVIDPDYDGVNHTGGFRVSWEVPQDTGLSSIGSAASITGYEMDYAEVVDDVPGEYTSTTLGSTTEYAFTGLKANAEYDIRIRARTAAGAGIEKHISGWVPSPPGIIDPDKIFLSLPTAHTFWIKWTAPEPGREGGSSSNFATTLYRVEVAPKRGEMAPEENEYILIRDNYSGNSITATNLNKSTEYLARITATNTWGGKASVSTHTVATIEQDSTPPSAVGGLKVTSFSNSWVVLSWAAPNDKGTTDGTTPATISNYIVKYRETAKSNFIEINNNSEGVRLAEALTGISTTATVIDLKANTSYTFLVVAINSANRFGLDDPTFSIEKTTAPLVPPQNLVSSTCEKTTSLGLAWDVSPGATFYKLYRDGVEIAGSTTTTTYTDTGLTPGMSYTYKVQACSDTGCSGDSDSLNIATLSEKSFTSIIYSGKVPTELSDYDNRSWDIFSLYDSGIPIVVKYVKEGGTGDGSSFADAAKDPKVVLDGITDASADKLYVILLSGGTYTPDTMSMKNHVAIVGGVDKCSGFSDTLTTLDGGNSYQVFTNYGLDHTALLYGVTVINGKDSQGGGMYNKNSSPTLTQVTFSGNSANDLGGGMYNSNSSPALTRVTFSGNQATSGGGMYNRNSSPVLIGVTFFGNQATNGGGMFNDNNGARGPTIVNGIFWTNTANFGPQFYMSNDGDNNNDEVSRENLRIYSSIVEGGTEPLTSGLFNSVYANLGGFTIKGGSAYTVITFDRISDQDPQLVALADNGGSVLTHAISGASEAVDLGLHVKQGSDGTLYYSDNNITWYASPTLSGSPATQHTDAKYLTATDATGYTLTGRPDLGAYEYRPK